MVLLIIGGYTSIPKLDKQFFPHLKSIRSRFSWSFAVGSSEVEEQGRFASRRHSRPQRDRGASGRPRGGWRCTGRGGERLPNQKLTNDINTRVDAQSFRQAERPTVTEITYRHQMGRVQIFGDK